MCRDYRGTAEEQPWLEAAQTCSSMEGSMEGSMEDSIEGSIEGSTEGSMEGSMESFDGGRMHRHVRRWKVRWKAYAQTWSSTRECSQQLRAPPRIHALRIGTRAVQRTSVCRYNELQGAISVLHDEAAR